MGWPRTSLIAGILCCLAGCAHQAPLESLEFTPDRVGLANAIRTMVNQSSQREPQLQLSIDAGPLLPMPVQLTRQHWGATRDRAAAGQFPVCEGQEWCLEPLDGRAAWLVDAQTLRVEPIEITPAAMSNAFLRAAPQSGLSVMILHDAADKAGRGRFAWRKVEERHTLVGDFVCWRNPHVREAQISHCNHISAYRQIAVVGKDGPAVLTPATRETFVATNDLRTLSPKSAIWVEHLWGSFRDWNSVGVQSVDSLGDNDICGMLIIEKVPQDTCIPFASLKSVRILQQGEAKPWTLGEYASLPFRVAQGVVSSIGIGGGH